MHKFEDWPNFLTFATMFDGIVFEKMNGEHGIVIGVMDEDIELENSLSTVIAKTLMAVTDQFTGEDDFSEDIDLDTLKSFEGRAVSIDNITYNNWNEWAKGASSNVKRAYVRIKGSRNIKSKLLKMTELAKVYLDPKVFDYNSDNTYLLWGH